MAIFGYTHLKIIESTFSKKKKVHFRVPSPNSPLLFLTMLTPKIFNHLLICMNLCQHAKTQLIPSVHSWDTVIFRVERPDWPDPLLAMPNQKIFNQLLIFVNLYQHEKNYALSSICVREMVDLKILECNWLRPFWPISQEDFSQI